jgi:hypothetical protein
MEAGCLHGLNCSATTTPSHTRGGMWSMDMAIRGGLLEEGDDTVYITLNVFVGVMYDYIRLEGPPSV